MADNDQKDLVIIGGGVGGVVCLYYAKKAGLDALLLEKQSVVGGLWAQLPAWQDIQVNLNDWTLGDLPITGEDQASVLHNIQAWVEKFDLASSILLDTPVTRASATGDGWSVSTPRTTYHSRWLVAATGGHNRPVVPMPERSHSSIREYHSSTLRDPAELAGKDVVVVGGGASAFDLLDLCFEHEASRVVWVYRSLRWMSPTTKPKHLRGGIRKLAEQQMRGVSVEQLNRASNEHMRSRYEKYGLEEILPEVEFDFDRHQLIPGRRRMIENFGSIERHRGEISHLCGKTVELSSGARVDADLILWGTGYELDLSYFDSPALAASTQMDAAAARCGSLVRSLDADNLFLLAPALLDTTSFGAPWAYAHVCRSIVSHIRGTAHLDTEPVTRKLNVFDLVRFLAERDPENYPADTWLAAYEDIAQTHPEGAPFPIP